MLHSHSIAQLLTPSQFILRLLLKARHREEKRSGRRPPTECERRKPSRVITALRPVVYLERRRTSIITFSQPR
jgi:hypothetical protein